MIKLKYLLVLCIFTVMACSGKHAKDMAQTGGVKHETGVSPVANAVENANPKLADKQQWKVYTGAWFSVKYPPLFTAAGTDKSATNTKGYDGATFTAPGGQLQFYVYAPQWSGNSTALKVLGTESELAREKQQSGDTVITRIHLAAADGSYHRLYEVRDDKKSGSKLIYGVKYGAESDYKRYREDYLRFKRSLQQYAD